MSWNPLPVVCQFLQFLISRLLSPNPPPPSAKLSRPRIAVIGAGLTGVAAAAHWRGHGFEVVVFEQGDSDQLGGIWARVNQTSGLQIHSLMYRFFPSIQWKLGYPNRQEILENIHKIWKDYSLEERTRFSVKVEQVRQDQDDERWIVNDNEQEYGKFDGIVAAIGTCGDQNAHIPGQEEFQGKLYHSSNLDGKHAEGKNVVIIGGGASAVEALEFTSAAKAEKTVVLSRSDKWIIPRNAIVDMLLAMNIFGQEIFLSWIPEKLLRIFFYRDLADLAPSSNSPGIFTETPMVNSEVLGKIRQGSASWLRGDILGFTKNGIRFSQRAQGVPPGGPGREITVPADLVIMATGFHRPSLGFLPEGCFQEPYAPPNWYLQSFPPGFPSVCANNCTYVNAIGTVGNYHIGIYTRILLMFLVDPLTRPRERLMKSWIDMTRFFKSRSPTPAFDFFTYAELLWWYFFCVAINPFRWKWALFIFFGIGQGLPLSFVEREDRLREKAGWNTENPIELELRKSRHA
ncbi:hypothetical protein D9757_002289 [Collybiopsis confluens]|uniref:FAD/NAD(P)-binding domain-containing protein n=1 Tax=Collybiopsis confluens TaxID=2823264 RepID=A0A8H5HZS9_9AGAR|nr:hypothetical protein D9757_002289 [Collybiopsis confluens]